MTGAEQRNAAKQFALDWKERAKKKGRASLSGSPFYATSLA